MTARTRTAALFAELGPVLAPEAIVFDPSASLWSVALGDRLRIDVALDTANEILFLAVRLPRPPEPVRARVLELLLRISFLWRETGGLRAALDGQGTPTLMQSVPVAGLDVDGLHRVLERMAADHAVWSDLMNGPTAATGEAEGTLPPGLFV